RHRTAAHKIGVGAPEGHRAGIVGEDPPHARRDHFGRAGYGREGKIEGRGAHRALRAAGPATLTRPSEPGFRAGAKMTNMLPGIRRQAMGGWFMEFGLQFFPSVGPADKAADLYFRESLQLAVMADELGFANIRVVEHYFHRYGGYSPNPLLF